MEINEFRKFLDDEEITCENGGCALAFVADSEGKTNAVIKGREKQILTMLLAAMSQSEEIRDSILSAAKCFNMVKDCYENQGN